MTVEVVEHTYSMQILSVPQNGTAVGTTAATPFSVRVLMDGTEPVVGIGILLGGSQEVVFASPCRLGSCTTLTDGNGVGSALITPRQPGTIALSASSVGLVQSTTFTATGPSETMRVVMQPGAGGLAVGDPVLLGVQLIGTDGTTTYENKPVLFTVLSGPFGLTGCGYATCGGSSDAGGVARMSGIAYGAGAITVQASQGDLTTTFSFTSYRKPDVLRLVSAPPAGKLCWAGGDDAVCGEGAVCGWCFRGAGTDCNACGYEWAGGAERVWRSANLRGAERRDGDGADAGDTRGGGHDRAAGD